MRLPALDERLSAAAQMMPACAYGADIGADHGRLSCYLLANGICGRMCVADISPASLDKAKRLLTLHGLADRADFSLSDGLAALPRKADAIAILGMGGYTLAGILENGADRLCGAALILSAHSDLPIVRKTLMGLHYRIGQEKAVLCGGRFYAVMRAAPGEERLDERQLLLGPRFLESPGDKIYCAYVEKKLAAASCRHDSDGVRAAALLKEEYLRVCHGTDGGNPDQ